MITKYRKYTTEHINENKLYEGKGIPNDLKWITDDIYDKISVNFNREHLFNFDEINFKVNDLSIKCRNEKHNTFIGNAKLGKFIENKLINPTISLTFNFDKANEKDIKTTLLHELLHLYELYNRILNDSDKSLQWNSNSILQKIRDKYSNNKFLEDFIYLLYLISDHEINARVSEVYKILIDCDNYNKETLINELYKTSSWKKLSIIENFFKYKHDIDYNLCTEFFNEYNSFMQSKSNQKFNMFNIPENKNDVDKILKLYKILFDKKALKIKNKLLKIVDEVIKDRT